jgi:hypothetical protein
VYPHNLPREKYISELQYISDKTKTKKYCDHIVPISKREQEKTSCSENKPQLVRIKSKAGIEPKT